MRELQRLFWALPFQRLFWTFDPRALRVPMIGLRRWGGALPPHTPPGIGAFGADAGALGPFTQGRARRKATRTWER